LEWFETCSCKLIPRDLPSSFTQLYDTVFRFPPFRVSLQHTESEEVFLVDRIEHRNRRPLDDLVLQGGNRKRALPAIRGALTQFVKGNVVRLGQHQVAAVIGEGRCKPVAG
jgi:hypothetical protein